MKKFLLIPCLALLSLYGCKTQNKDAKTNTHTITLALEAKSDSKVKGEATFVEKDGKVTFTAHIYNLEPGTHAIHIHEKSDCSDPKAASAGGHWNPTFKKHGKWGSAEHHKGDIGNFTANETGHGMITMTTDEWCISCDDPNKNIVGKSLIVHEKADDFVTQPTGDAGGRVACAGIIR